MRRHFALFSVLVTCLALTGCAKQADPEKPIETIKQEVQTMSVKDLESSAKAYASAIQKKATEAEAVKADLKQIDVKEMFGEEAKKIKAEISRISGDISALKQRYSIYADKFREMGGDISKVQIAT